MNQGYVYLIGAGCGKADLLTLRGKQRLEGCDVVVYDDLIDPAILNFVPQTAQRIYMGKREGRHSAQQKEISAKLVDLAAQGLTVARLKGGDPFVFGRGGEEILALKQAGIPFEAVPGISSAIAIPAGAGIPVTHRGLSQSVHIITGHTADTPDALPADFPHLAKGKGTLVFLMGLGRLGLIAERLMKHGRPPDTPAAVISGGNSPNPAAVRGTLTNIAEKARGVLPPAVIVVGAVAALDLSSTISYPLSGVRIGVTGTAQVTDKLTRTLEQLGAAICPLAQTAIVPLSPDLSLLKTPAPKWLVFTSPNGVDVFFSRLRGQHTDLRALSACRFAAIGPATTEALEQRGIYPDLCPKNHTSAALAQALVETASPEEPIFLLRSAKGAPILKQLPEQAGFCVHDIPLYDIIPAEPQSAAELEPLSYLTFCSAGGVEEYFLQYGALPEQTVPVCIGPVTAAALKKHTDRPILLASDTTIDAVVQAIFNHHTK